MRLANSLFACAGTASAILGVALALDQASPSAEAAPPAGEYGTIRGR